jgi:hypothetical protein
LIPYSPKEAETNLYNGLTWNQNCWAYPFDLSCTSYGNTQMGVRGAGTLVSPRLIVLANHYPIQIGATMRFLTRANEIVDRKLIATRRAGASDILLGQLDSEVSIPPAKLAPPDAKIEVGMPLLYLNQKKEARIAELSAYGIGVIIRKALGSPTRGKLFKPIVVGDSGNPIFCIDGDNLYLISHFTMSSGGICYARFHKDFTDAMAALGG